MLNKLKNIQDDEFSIILEQKGIKNLNDVKQFVNEKIANGKEKNMQETHNFEELNDLVSYGVTGNTLHIHLVPNDAKSFLTKDGLKVAETRLIDALQKINSILEQNDGKDIENVYAVSSIMKGPIVKIFKNLGFDVSVERVEKAKEDSELGKFYEIFKDKKDIGRAVIGREKQIIK